MSIEKPKKRQQDEVYSILIISLHRTVKQITEIYNLCFDDVITHIESQEHGC